MNGHRRIPLIVMPILALAFPILIVAEASGGLAKQPLYQSIDVLCEILNCLPPPPPRIDDVVGNFTPGGFVYVAGSGFGTTPGEVHLRGQGFPGGYLKVAILAWSDTEVRGTVPPVTGAPDQHVALSLVTSTGVEVGHFDEPFTASRDVIELPQSAVHVGKCSFTAERNNCNGTMSPPESYSGNFPIFSSVSGFHQNGLLRLSSSAGRDEYWVVLANGWVFHSVSAEPYSGWGGSWSHAGWASGKPSLTLLVSWSLAPFGYLTYDLHLYVIGPSGNPYR